MNTELTKFLDAHGVKYRTENDRVVVDRSLDFSNIDTIPEGFNPEVGGSLYLNSLTTIPEGFNPQRVAGKIRLGVKSYLPII